MNVMRITPMTVGTSVAVLRARYLDIPATLSTALLITTNNYTISVLTH